MHVLPLGDRPTGKGGEERALPGEAWTSACLHCAGGSVPEAMQAHLTSLSMTYRRIVVRQTGTRGRYHG